jgi:hypothetical protein
MYCVLYISEYISYVGMVLLLLSAYIPSVCMYGNLQTIALREIMRSDIETDVKTSPII